MYLSKVRVIYMFNWFIIYIYISGRFSVGNISLLIDFNDKHKVYKTSYYKYQWGSDETASVGFQEVKEGKPELHFPSEKWEAEASCVKFSPEFKKSDMFQVPAALKCWFGSLGEVTLSGDIKSNTVILPNLVAHLHGNDICVSCEQSERISALYDETRPTYPECL